MEDEVGWEERKRRSSVCLLALVKWDVLAVGNIGNSRIGISHQAHGRFHRNNWSKWLAYMIVYADKPGTMTIWRFFGRWYVT